MATEPESTGRQQANSRFVRGKSGNPRGRPVGSRNKALMALDMIGEADAGEILRGVVAAAKAGDARSAELILRRAWPERRGRPVMIPDLPIITRPQDVVVGLSAIVTAVAAGQLSPEEAAAVGAILEMQARAFQSADLEQRLVALEQASEPHP